MRTHIRTHAYAHAHTQKKILRKSGKHVANFYLSDEYFIFLIKGKTLIIIINENNIRGWGWGGVDKGH